MMERYRILEHAADGKFRAFGETLEKAFGNAALVVVDL
jgi:SHS2 domain-containing protein